MATEGAWSRPLSQEGLTIVHWALEARGGGLLRASSVSDCPVTLVRSLDRFSSALGHGDLCYYRASCFGVSSDMGGLQA